MANENLQDMKAHNSDNFKQNNRDENTHSDYRFGKRKQPEDKSGFGGNKRILALNWKTRLIEVAMAALFGVLAVWGLQEYRQLTALSLEMGSSVNFYENAELRAIRFIDSQNFAQNTDLQDDLKEIEKTQELLKQALLYSPENKKERIYELLIKCYDIKLQLLERTYRLEGSEYQRTKKTGTSL